MTPVMPVNALRDGDVQPCRVDGVEILLCRVDGRFYAVAGRCSHAGQALAGGRLRGFALRCPLHGASFDIRDGRALTAPASVGIATYPVQIDAGKVLVAAHRPRRPDGGNPA